MVRVRSRDGESGDVNARRLAPGSVHRHHLAFGAVGPEGLRGGSVLSGAVAPGAINESGLGDRAVTAPKLDDYAVTEPKLAPGSVTAPAIGDGAVTAPAIADGSVTGPKVPTGALDARTLADGTLTMPKFAQGVRPVQIVDSLPVSPLADGFLPGDAVVDVAGDDAKIFRLKLPWDRWDATDDTWNAADDLWPTATWTSQVDTFDLRGLIEEGQIGQGAVVAGTVAAGAIGTTELAAFYVEVGKWIRSFNWDPGVAGWAIDGDGNAEFNDVTIRGGVLVGGTLTTSALKSADYLAGSTGWALDPAGNTEFNDVTIRGSVVVGGTLTGSDLKSSNYTAGSAGWALDGAGNAELNDATFRGNIKASSVTSGQLVSSNYAAGSAGWALDANGNAELNDATFRGNIKASSVTSGQLVSSNYSAGSLGWALDAAGNVEFNDATVRGVFEAGGGVLQVDGNGIQLGDDGTGISTIQWGTLTSSPTVSAFGDQLRVEANEIRFFAYDAIFPRGGIAVDGSVEFIGTNGHRVDAHPTRDWLSLSNGGLRKVGVGTGAMAPENDGTYDLGATGLRWGAIYGASLDISGAKNARITDVSDGREYRFAAVEADEPGLLLHRMTVEVVNGSATASLPAHWTRLTRDGDAWAVPLSGEGQTQTDGRAWPRATVDLAAGEVTLSAPPGTYRVFVMACRDDAAVADWTHQVPDEELVA